jgi:hypothetical protein
MGTRTAGGRGRLGGLIRRLGHRSASDQPAARRRTTLLDPELQHRFEQDGYVVVDLLDEEALSAVAARYDAMDHERREHFDWVEGFSTSIYDARPEYRREVLDVMDEIVQPALAGVLDHYRIFWANFLVKQPGADPVPPHVDWTFLDEDRFSSVTIWCPLRDTTPENGTLGVVSGSHRRIDFLRAANVPTFERCVAAVADIEDRPVIPVRAGQAIVMDNRVVHFSTPNADDESRVVIGCVAGPVEAELHHYWMDEQERLLRFDIDRSFYLDYVIGEPPSRAGGVRGSTPANA